MKFEYLGEDNTFTLELTAYGIKRKGEYMKNGDIVDVPDKLTNVISALDESGLYRRVEEEKGKKGDKK